MKLIHLALLSSLVVSPTWASVKAYFNHSTKSSYVDPYRNIHRTGDNLEEQILKEIKKAKKSIYIAVQELRLPLIAQALIDKKIKEKVDVRVVLEHDYNFNVLSQREGTEGEYEASKLTELRAFVDRDNNGLITKEEMSTHDAIYMLQAAKIPIMDDTFDNSRGAGLMHHKFMVVDGKSTVVSSANFTMSCIHGDKLSPTSRGNANSMLVVQSIAFAELFQEEFLQLWGNGRRGNFGHNKTYRGPQTVTVRGVKLTVQFSPTSARYNWEESVNGLIASHLAKANTSVKGALFVFSDQRLADVLEKRHDKGVDMGFLIESKFAFRDYSELWDMFGTAMLTQKCSYEPDNNPWKNPATELGTAILNKGDVLHHKFAVIDHKTVVMGSQNWSRAANYTNDETLVVVEGKTISDLYTQEYNRLKSKSRIGIPTHLQSEIRRLETICANAGFYF